jgi:hypothetical protein
LKSPASRESGGDIGRSVKSTVTLSAFFWSAAVIGLTLQLVSRNAMLGVSNWFVPDGISLATTFHEQWLGVSYSVEYLGSAGMNYAYFLALVVGVIGFSITNIFVLWVARRRFYSSFPLARTLFLIPYFLVAVALPSKDILVLAAYMLFFGALIRERLVWAAVIAVSVFLIRDGAMVMLVGTVIIWAVIRNSNGLVLPAVAAILVSAILADLVAESLFGDLFIFARQAAVVESIGSVNLDAVRRGGAALRIFANLTNLAFRPAFLDADGGVALTGVVYWISGVTLLYAFGAATAFVWRRQSKPELLAGLLFFVSLGVLAVSPLIQPRYLFPAASIVLAVHQNTRSVFSPGLGWLTSMFMSIPAIIFYVISSIGLPPQIAVDHWSPFWLF